LTWNDFFLRRKCVCVKVALIPFITAGDPDLSTTAEALKVLDSCGSDIIELGVPYSDPLADGPVIQVWLFLPFYWYLAWFANQTDMSFCSGCCYTSFNKGDQFWFNYFYVEWGNFYETIFHFQVINYNYYVGNSAFNAVGP